MQNIFSIICKKCGGKCCKSTIFLTKKDVDKLRSAGEQFKVKERGVMFLMVLDEGKCPFLNEETGCTLTENLKPFDCTLFPVAFTYKNGKAKFYLNKKCPYFNEIPKEWMEKTKKWALEQLKYLSEEEKRAFSKLIGNHAFSGLLPV